MARNNQRGRAKPHKRTGAINSKETGHAGAERSERPAQTPAAQERPKSPGKSPHRSAQEQGRTRSQRSSRERMRGQNSTRGHTSHDTGKREPAASRAASTQAQDKSHPRKKPDTAAERPRRSEAIDTPRPKRSTNRGEKHGSALMETVGGFLHSLNRQQVLAIAAAVAVVLLLAASFTHKNLQEQEAPAEENPVEQRVQDIVSAMSNEQKVAQLFVTRPEDICGVSPVTEAGEGTRTALEQYPVGGLCYFSENITSPEQTQTMLANTQDYATQIEGLPIFLGIDEEGGTVARIANSGLFEVANVGNMADVGASGSTESAKTAATETARYLTDIGFNLNFAPVADIASSSESIMAQRSFGASADAVAPMVQAQVEGYNEAGILCCAKHFPGIGGMTEDPHETRVVIDKDADGLAAEELVPFQSAIDAGAPIIMVGHLSCPNVVGNDTPASMSGEVVTGLLRERLGYDGIVITDSLSMGAITGYYNAADVGVEAIQAGCDMLLTPEDFATTYEGVLEAVESGDISQERLDQSVTRIVRAKMVLEDTTAARPVDESADNSASTETEGTESLSSEESENEDSYAESTESEDLGTEGSESEGLDSVDTEYGDSDSSDDEYSSSEDLDTEGGNSTDLDSDDDSLGTDIEGSGSTSQ